jgi:hypothetical protein
MQKAGFSFFSGLIFFLLSGNLYSFGKNDSLSRFRMGVSLATDLSYTGISGSLSGTLNYKKLKAKIGVKKNINRSYIPTTSPVGLIATLMYFPIENPRKISGFFNLDYQILFLTPYCPTGDCNVKYNFINEYSLGYGFRFGIGKSLSIINSINVGRYSEYYYSNFQGERIVFHGYNTLVRAGIHYEF